MLSRAGQRVVLKAGFDPIPPELAQRQLDWLAN
jgi:hypothetical protein